MQAVEEDQAAGAREDHNAAHNDIHGEQGLVEASSVLHVVEDDIGDDKQLHGGVQEEAVEHDDALRRHGAGHNAESHSCSGAPNAAAGADSRCPLAS